MEFKSKKVCNYEFVKIGEFIRSDKPLECTFNKQPFKWYLEFKPVNKNIINAEKSAYLFFQNDELLYVGYYSTTLEERMLRKQNDRYYLWHSIDEKVNELVEKDIDVSLWITVDPYEGEHNISKNIEDKIIAEYSKKGILNTVGKHSTWYKENSRPVKEILNL